MDTGLTIVFIASVLISTLFIATACVRFYKLILKKGNEFYVLKKTIHPIDTIELVDFSQKRMERELTKDEELKKAA